MCMEREREGKGQAFTKGEKGEWRTPVKGREREQQQPADRETRSGEICTHFHDRQTERNRHIRSFRKKGEKRRQQKGRNRLRVCTF